MYTPNRKAKSGVSTRITVSLPEKGHAALVVPAHKYESSLSRVTCEAVIEFLHLQGKNDAHFTFDPPLRNTAENE
jgi:hypothetical protein